MEDGQPPNAFNNFEGAPPAFLAHDYVPPVEAGLAYVTQTIAAPGVIVDVADEILL